MSENRREGGGLTHTVEGRGLSLQLPVLTVNTNVDSHVTTVN